MFTANAHLNINYTSKTGTIIDNTDYSPLNPVQVNIVGTGTITGPDGSVVASGVTVNISAGSTVSAPFNLPVDNNGNVLSGQYTLVYVPTFTVQNISVSSFTTAPDTIVISGVDWTNIFDEPGASNSVTITLATTPANNGPAPITGVSYVGPATVLSTSKTMVAELGGAAEISFVVTYNEFVDALYTFTGADIATLSVDATYDCDSTQFGQIIFKDNTILPEDQVLTTRTFTVAYPTNLTNPATPPNIVTTQPSVVVNQLAVGQWTYRLTYLVTATQDDELTYTYTITTGSVPVNVSCAGTFCELICGMKTLYGKYADSVSCGTPNAQYASVIALIPGYYMIAVQAKSCGDTDTYNKYYNMAKELLGDCNCGCDECTDNPEDVNYWVNNAGFEAQTTLENLVIEVAGLSQIIQDNASAQAAFNALVIQMNGILSQTVSFLSAITSIQGQMAALDPNSPTFDDDVNNLEANLSNLITSFGSTSTDLATLLNDINAFQTNFPQYDSYWENIIIGYANVSNSFNNVTNDANDLLTLLGTLTSVNYAALIAQLLQDVINLQSQIDSISLEQVNISSQIQGVISTVNNIAQQVSTNTADITALQNAVTQLDGLLQIINANGDAGAQALYNSLIAQIDVILAQSIGFVSDIGTIDSIINLLNPEDPAFADQVTLLQSVLGTLITNIQAMQPLLTTLSNDIAFFQSLYPQYTDLLQSLQASYNAVFVLVSNVGGDANLLYAILGTLTPANYAALIAQIQADVANIYSQLQQLNNIQIQANAQIQSIITTLGLFSNQITAMQAQLAGLQATQENELFVASAEVNGQAGVFFPGVTIPGEFFRGANGVKGYVKIRIDAVNTVAGSFNVRVINDTTALTIFSVGATAKQTLSIDVILQYSATQFYVSGTYWAADLASAPSTTDSFSFITPPIPLTTVLPGVPNQLSVASTNANTQIIRQEIIGVKMF